MIVRRNPSNRARALASMAMVGLALACLLGIGGCAQRMAVEGTRDQLFAEAKGALESEGFRTMGAHPSVASAKGTSRAEGRLQFLYYTDTIAPTVVEVRIEPGPELAAMVEDQSGTALEASAGSAAGSTSGTAAVGQGPADARGDAESHPVNGNNAALGASARPATGRAGHGSYSVAISAWSSLTFAPDPWITDLAVGALRRAFLLSGNMR